MRDVLECPRVWPWASRRGPRLVRGHGDPVAVAPRMPSMYAQIGRNRMNTSGRGPTFGRNRSTRPPLLRFLQSSHYDTAKPRELQPAKTLYAAPREWDDVGFSPECARRDTGIIHSWARADRNRNDVSYAVLSSDGRAVRTRRSISESRARTARTRLRGRPLHRVRWRTRTDLREGCGAYCRTRTEASPCGGSKRSLRTDLQ
jgi:hypothetical protein